MTTIKEIAEKSGYSTSTVSRLLNHDASFSISTTARQRILDVAHSLNYHADNGLKHITHHSALLFAVAPSKELEDSYYTAIRQSLMKAAAAADISLSFYRQFSDVPPDIDSFIAVGNFTASALEQLRQHAGQVVFVDANPDPGLFTSVQPNLELIVTQAINLFATAHKSPIGFLGGRGWLQSDTATPAIDARQQYFESVARIHQCFDPDTVFIGPDFSRESGQAIGQAVIKAYANKPLPQAFLVASDALCIGVLEAFAQAGIHVPEDTALISINDIDIAKYVTPTLTSFHIDVDELARLSLNTLRDLLTLPQTNSHVLLLKAKPIFRESFPDPFAQN